MSDAIQIPGLQHHIVAQHERDRGGLVTVQEAAKQMLRMATEVALSAGLLPQDHFDVCGAAIQVVMDRGAVMPIDGALGLLQYTTILLCHAAGQSHSLALANTMTALDTMSLEERQAEWRKLAEGIEDYRFRQIHDKYL